LTTTKPERRVHTSIDFTEKQHRALMDKLYKERKSLSQWGREQAEQYIAKSQH